MTELTTATKATGADPLRAELAQLLDRVPQGRHQARNQQIVAQHLGLDGEGGTSAAAAGAPHKLTRETARQIVTLAQQALEDAKLSPGPRLAEALDLLSTLAPCPAEDAELALQQAGLTDAPFRIEGVLNVAQWLGVPSLPVMDEIGDQRLLQLANKPLPAKELRILCVKHVRRHGCARVADLASESGIDFGGRLVRRWIEAVLDAERDDFEWLDGDRNWCWFRTLNRNALVNQAIKAVAVAGPVSLAELRLLAKRALRHTEELPPDHVLARLLMSSGEFDVIEGIVDLTKPVAESSVLRPAEQTMVEVLREHGRQIAEREFEDAVLGMGVGKFDYSMVLNYSPVLRRVSPGVYALAGSSLGVTTPPF